MKPLSLCIALCLLLTACAHDRPPTGGPRDNEPLEILSVNPPSSSVNISPERIHFSFNRYVTASSLRNALVFSPAITDYTLNGNGTEAEIVFRKPLETNKTYTITLNTSLRSSRGNVLLQSYTYAFSTGPEINRGIIAGQVFSNDTRPLPRALVLAYAVPKDDSLSFNPFERKPDYSVQTGYDGRFTLDYLAEGNYRLIALQDSNGDKKLNPGSEFSGTGYRELVGTGTSDNLFRLAEPAGHPKLIYCTSPAGNVLEISFDRPFPVENFKLSSVAVLDTVRNTVLPVKGFYSVKATSRARTFRIVTGSLEKKSGYRITYSPGDGEQTSSTACRGNDKQEKETIAITQLLPKNGTAKAFLAPTHPERGRTVDVSFNIPVEQESLERAILLFSLNGEDPTPLAFTIQPIDDRRYTLQANPAFRNGNAYRLDIQLKNLIGLNGERAPDSLVTSAFTVADSEDFGTITGTVSGGTGTVIVEVLDSMNRLPRRTVVQRSNDSPADFSIDELAPGKYTLRAFIPRSEMQPGTKPSWNPGNIYPFEPADLFTVNNDTVTVRKGWETENINLVFPAMVPLMQPYSPSNP